MKILASLLIAATAFSCPLASSSQSIPLPANDGIYILNGNHWDRMYVVSVSGYHVSGGMKTAFSYGIASVKTVLSYRDAEAPIRTAYSRPTFCIVGPSATAPRDIVIVRLKQKKDHRELQIGKANAYTGANVEYPNGDVTEVAVTEVGSGRVLVPTTDLKPGEYILFAGTSTQMPTGYGGYDFSEGTQQ